MYVCVRATNNFFERRIFIFLVRSFLGGRLLQVETGSEINQRERVLSIVDSFLTAYVSAMSMACGLFFILKLRRRENSNFKIDCAFF